MNHSRKCIYQQTKPIKILLTGMNHYLYSSYLNKIFKLKQHAIFKRLILKLETNLSENIRNTFSYR